jgi:hypothetical protein
MPPFVFKAGSANVAYARSTGHAPRLPPASPCRLLRIFKLARKWKGLHRLLSVAGRSVISVGHLTVILVVVFVTFGLMGMSLFNYKMSSCPVDGTLQACPPGESCPDTWDCYIKCSADEVSRLPCTMKPMTKGSVGLNPAER